MRTRNKHYASKNMRRQQGFTLVEAMVALGIMMVLMLGTMDLFIGSLRLASRSTAEVFASQDAARSLRHIIDDTREALWFALPDANDANDLSNSGTLYFTEELATVTGMSSYTTANFISHDSTSSNFCDTGMFIAFPAADSSEGVILTSSATQSLSTASNKYNLYNRTSPFGSYLFLYRANSNGTPNALTGTCLWEVGTDNGATVNQAIITSVNSSWDAIQFLRPWNTTNNTGTPNIPYEAEIKITSGYFSIINGVQTNESTGGADKNTTQLVGKCIAMRNFELTSVHIPKNVSATSIGNRFKAS